MKVKLVLLTILYILSVNISTVFADETKILSPPVISAESAILIDASTGIILYEKNSHTQEYPASITKIMTALLAIEFADGDYDKIVEFRDTAVFGIPTNSSRIYMDVDETLTLNDALLAIMLASANDVSIAVAELISGTEEEFAKLMTERAAEIGAKNTNFLNSSGLPDPDHYTTAYDMALIMQEAMKHEKFVELITTKSYWIPPTEKQPAERPLNNTHRMIFPGSFFYEPTVGGKTGYTIEAKHTLVTHAKQGSTELIAVLLRNDKNLNYVDSATLFDYGFDLFADANLFDFHQSDFSETLSIVQADSNGIENVVGEAQISARQNFSVPLPNFSNTSNVRIVPDIPKTLNYTIRNGDNIGVLQFHYNGNIIHEIDLFVEDATMVLSASESEDLIYTSSNKNNILNRIWLVIPAILFAFGFARSILKKRRRAARLRLRYSRYK